MSLLDAAKQMNRRPPVGDGSICGYCRNDLLKSGSQHWPDCPWLSMPRIVAALEAAEEVLREDERLHCSDSCLDESLNTLEAALRDEPR